MSELTQSQIVAAVAENRMSAQEAYRLLQGAGAEPTHQQVVRERSWTLIDTAGTNSSEPENWGVVLVAPGPTDVAEVSELAGDATVGVLRLPELTDDPTPEFTEFWASQVVPLLEDVEQVTVVFSTPGQTTTNPDTALLFLVAQALLRGRPAQPVRLVCHLWRDDSRALAWAQACAALLGCVELENPQVNSAVLWTPDHRIPALGARLTAATRAAASLPSGRVIRIGVDGAVAVLDARAPGEADESGSNGPGIEQTAFFITGGSGGLARLLGAELARRGAAAVVLNGRRPLAKLDAALVDLVEGSQGRVRYVDAVLTSPADCVDQLRQAQGDAARVCVLHCAGVRNDAFLIKQDLPTFLDTAAPKTGLTDHLVAAVGQLRDAVLVGFSSVTALVGNAGQSAYAFANGYLDGLAQAEHDRGAPAAFLSLGWPLWNEGGMQLDEQARQRMRESTGMVPLDTAGGVDFLIGQLRSGTTGSRVLLYGVADQLERMLDPGQESLPAGPATQVADTPGIDPEELHRLTCRYLVTTICEVTEIPASDIHLDEPFDQFGLDSIVAMRIGDALEANFDGLPKTLLFEYQNINELAAYFIANHGAGLPELLGLSVEASRPAPGSPDVPAERAMPNRPTATERSDEQVRLTQAAAGQPRPAAQAADDRIAIVGLAGRYPQADSIEAFWRNLVGGVDSIIEIPEDRWDREEFFSPHKGELGRTNSRWGGFLDGIDQFDPRLFHINAREAMIMDPQERLFLETAWTAVEDAGYRPSELRGRRVAVFAGAMYTEYQMLPSHAEGRVIAHSSLHSSIANRVSYYLDLTGPSVALDTMCSSSLVAVHYACRSIIDGEAEMAIAGGVNVSLTPEKYLFLSQGNFLSSDGRCRAFGAGGDGYVPSEGVGAVILKRLDDAVAAGDHIYGVIRGSAVNHDGKTSGYTVPNPKSQADVIARALSAGRVDPAEVSYVEAHGTGTELGDPIELSGLSQVFGGVTPSGGRTTRAIGSVKSNIGHAESAAGIASLTKVLLQLRARELAPSIHTEQLNPMIDFEGHGFTVQRSHEPWDVIPGARRVAGISCFGAGGTNAHLVVEEFPEPDAGTDDGRRVFVPFSSASEAQLRQLLENFVARLSGPQHGSLRLSDIAYTMQRGRELMAVRLVVFARSVAELLARIVDFLENWAEGPDVIFRPSNPADPDAEFFFGGQQGRDFIAGLVDQRQLDQLARIWIKGYPIEVERLYDTPRRVSLPTHVFDHASYWIPRQPSAQRGRISELLDANESDLDGVRFTTTFEASGGAKSGYVTADGEVSPLAGVAVVEDAFTQLTGQPVGNLRFLRFDVHRQGPAPLTYTLRAARGSLGVICETTGPHDTITCQASVAAQTLSEQWLAESPTDEQSQVHSIDTGQSAASSPLTAVLAGALQVLGRGADQSGLLEVQNLELLATGLADRVLEQPATAGQGRDLHFFESGTRRLIARALGVGLIPDAAPTTEPLAIGSSVPAAPSQSDEVADFVLEICADLFGVPRERLELGVPFDEYGMDSVLIGRFAERIRTRFPDVTVAVFFDHETIGALIDHLTEDLPTAADGQPEPVAAAMPALDAAPATAGPPRPAAAITSLIRGAEAVVDEPVAIIGMSGVFPEAPDLAGYWANLLAGRESIGLIPSDRWDYRRHFDPAFELPRQGTSYAPWGGFVDNPFGFDNRFFNITPADAVVIDPQERMLLETVWQTLEDAGRTRASLRRDTADELGEDVGVFVGTTSQTYQFWGVEQALGEDPVLTNASPWSLANRVSYFFDFSGPSMPIDTACSSGLSAVHLAMESLRSQECTSAIAAGVNLFLHPLKYASMCQMKMLSPTGRLSAFGANADGFVPGEGVAAVLLKPLSRAIADGDRIRAVIRSSTVNHGGRTNGYTVPSVSAQSRLLRRAWQQAGVEPDSIGYLEMHGTGTRLGDPIEVEAATRAMRARTDRRQFCAIGSVKPNIGHLESCSGLASLIKVVRQMETGTLVPSINATPRNPRLDLESSPFFITDQPMTWQPDPRSAVRRAGISSFGAGGSNAHIVVESFHPQPGGSDAGQPQLIVLSARTPDRLPLLAEQLADHLAAHPETALADLAWTLQIGREALSARLAFVAADPGQCLATLRELAGGASPESVTGFGGAPELETIARDWLAGAEVDWAALHAQRPQLISLPGYPFDHTRFVVERGARAPLSASQAEQVASTVRERREDRAVDPELRDVHPQTSTHIPVWHEHAAAAHPKNWRGRRVALLFDPSHTELAGLLNEQLQAAGAEVADQPGPDSTDIIWAPQPVRAGSDDLWDEAALAAEAEQRLVALLDIVKVIGAREADSGCDIHLVTDRVHDLDGVPQRPYGAGGSALVRSAAKEIAGLRGVAVDLDLADEQTRLADVCATILAIGASADVEEVIVRAGQAKVLRLASASLPLAEQQPTAPGSVHVIVGGLGSVGFCYAEHLVHTYGARVCLVGRSPLDATRRALCERLGDQGVHYLYRAVDATDAEGLATVLTEVEQDWGPIDALVHSSMVFDETPVADMAPHTLLAVLRPKTRALQAMLQAARGRQIGRVLAFSSSQAYLGSRNRAHYAAACAGLQSYLDAMRAELQVPIHRIDWGFWGTDKGRPIDRGFSDFLALRGIRPISAADGMDVIDRVLANAIREVTVVTVSDRVKAHLPILVGATETAVVGASVPIASVPIASEPTPAAVPPPPPGGPTPPPPAQWLPVAGAPDGSDTSASLTTLLAQVIGGAPADIDPAASFMDIGLDSISGLRFVHAVNEALSIELGDTVVFDHPTINALAQHIQDNHGHAVPTVAEPDTDEVLALFKRLEARELTPGELLSRGGVEGVQ